MISENPDVHSEAHAGVYVLMFILLLSSRDLFVIITILQVLQCHSQALCRYASNKQINLMPVLGLRQWKFKYAWLGQGKSLHANFSVYL